MWLIVAVIVLGAITAGLFTFLDRPGQGGAAADRGGEAQIPVATFRDITAEAGITFVHTNGAYGEKLLPETMGGGVAFLDFDNDGAPDLLFINSGPWPWHRAPGPRPGLAALFRNDGNGRFSNVTESSGLAGDLYAMGVAVGDYDNDGLVDVFVSGVGGNRLFHNRGGGRFEDVTAASGVGGDGDGWGASCAWIDYDNDGRLDLFVCNYLRWTREIDLGANYQLPGIGRAYGPPVNFPGTHPLLFRNEGSGRFRDVSRAADVQVMNPASGQPMAKSLGVAPVDLDGDGWIDLVVANDTVQNFVFMNQKNGTFREVGARTGIGYDSFGQTRGAMGIDTARFRNDDTLGIAIGNFANEMNSLYVSQRDGLVFSDEAVREGVGPASQSLLKFGLFFFDYDLDGRLDMMTANGHLETDISKVRPDQQYRQPAQLFWNRGGGGRRFVPVPAAQCGSDIFKPMVGRGSAFADIDGDGDLDAVITQINGAPLLLRNEQELGHHWVRIRLEGVRSNRDAIGAWVRVRVGSQHLSRQVMAARGYLSQSELPVTFGLGRNTRVDEVLVIWPDGSKQGVENIQVDRLNVVRQK
jgi:hypothetical protein